MKILILSCMIPAFVVGSIFKDVYEFKYFDYDYPTDQEREESINNKTFIPGNPLAIDVDVYYTKKSRKVFVTAAVFYPGVPATVGVVTDKKRNGQNLLAPYPHWSWHIDQKKCKKDRIVSVFRVQIDKCGRIWILDSGRYETMVCRPQLLAFNLETDKLVYRHEFSENFFDNRSLFVTPVLDIRDSCDNIFVYIADGRTFRLIVHDVVHKESWIVTDKTMEANESLKNATINGVSFTLNDGILGMALEPYVPGEDRRLFFRGLTSITENFVHTSQLQNRCRFKNTQYAPEIFFTYNGTRFSQSSPQAINKNGIQLFGQVAQNSIYCWNTKTEYGEKNIKLVEHNDEKFQFNSGIKVITNNKNMEEVWIVTNRLQKSFTKTQDLNEVNFRVMKANVKDIKFCK